jgi:hypothetical protein
MEPAEAGCEAFGDASSTAHARLALAQRDLFILFTLREFPSFDAVLSLLKLCGQAVSRRELEDRIEDLLYDPETSRSACSMCVSNKRMLTLARRRHVAERLASLSPAVKQRVWTEFHICRQLFVTGAQSVSAASVVWGETGLFVAGVPPVLQRRPAAADAEGASDSESEGEETPAPGVPLIAARPAIIGPNTQPPQQPPPPPPPPALSTPRPPAQSSPGTGSATQSFAAPQATRPQPAYRALLASHRRSAEQARRRAEANVATLFPYGCVGVLRSLQSPRRDVPLTGPLCVVRDAVVCFTRSGRFSIRNDRAAMVLVDGWPVPRGCVRTLTANSVVRFLSSGGGGRTRTYVFEPNTDLQRSAQREAAASAASS